MRESRKNLKLKARRVMTGKYSIAAGVFAIWLLMDLVFLCMWKICMLFSGILAASMEDVRTGFLSMLAVMGALALVFLLFEALLVPGLLRLYLNICRGRLAGVWDMFWGFHSHPGKFFGINLLFLMLAAVLATPQAVLTAAAAISGDWQFARMYLPGYGLLLLAAGTWAGLTYGQFYMILAEDPEKSLLSALEESREMMRGNRGRLLALFLSFAVWIPVVCLTLGAALIWLTPYFMCTMVFFYLDGRDRGAAGDCLDAEDDPDGREDEYQE